MVNFDYSEKFDFIILPDALEHISMEQDHGLFGVLSKLIYNPTIIIQTPHPKALNYIKEHTPEKLQIIDRSIAANTLMQNTYANDLGLVNYSSYSLFIEEADYALARFKKNTKSMLTPYNKPVIIPKKVIGKD